MELGPTLLEDFARSADAHPERALFVHGEGTLRYGEAATAIARAVDRLAAVDERGPVLCLAEDTIPLALFMLAAGYARRIPTAVSPVFSATYVAAVAQQIGARAVFTTPAFVEQAAALGLPVWCHGGRGPGGNDGDAASELLFEPCDADPRAIAALRGLAGAVGDADPFVLQPTAGSTGTPKLVLRPFAAFSRYARFVGDEVRKLGAAAPLRVLAICSMTHAFAGHMFAMAVRLGAELAVPQQIDALASLDEVRALDPDVLPMTPRVLAALVRDAELRGAVRQFGPRARLVISAGGKADPRAFERLRAQGVEVLEVYGSSEASVVAVTPLGAWHAGRAGVPVADVELRITDDGELLVRSAGVALCYHADQDRRALVGPDGFYRTGDAGRLDDAGYLEILGRTRDVLNTPEGSNIYPARIEAMLESLERVEQAVVLGDGQAFLTAHLVVRDPPPGAARWIDSARHAALYDEIGLALRALNGCLELIEQVVAFALYRRPFPDAMYRAVAGGKVARDRRALAVELAAIADRLYAPTLADDSPMLVPPKQRRFADRVTSRRRTR